VFEANAYQAVGPIHPTDPVQTEWGFARTGLSIHLWQKGPQGPIRSIGFYSCGFKVAEKRYTTWEKGLFVVSLASREAERTIRQQPIILWGPFKVTKAVLTGTPPPDGVAQRASVRKWYAQIEHYCEIFSVSEGATKVLDIQDEADLDKDVPQLAPVIQIAPPFSEQLQNVRFTDTSSKREGKIWKYRAVALQVGTKEQIITEGEGSVQVGDLTAVWSVFQHEAQAASPVYIYTDSCTVFKGCTEWLPFWEQNEWEVNRIPIRQKEKWQDILAIDKCGKFAVAWVASHQQSDTPVNQWNDEVDELARLAPLQSTQITENWEHSLERLHIKRKHSGINDLFREAQARGWPITREECKTCISSCEQCCVRLGRHPLENGPLHLREGKGL